MNRSLLGAHAVVRALEDEGIPFAFGIPGTHNIELYDRLAKSTSVRTILVTDEQSASFMADGLWRATGKLGCVNVVPGAGLTHAMSGIGEAFMDNVPLLVLGCGIRRDTGHAYQLHDVDQLAMVAPITKAVFRPERGVDIYPVIRRACAIARAGAPGPVMVEIPANLYLRPGHVPGEAAAADDDGTTASEPERAVGAKSAHRPDPALVRRAAEILSDAGRPLLYVGAGAADAGGAAGLLVRLAERLGAPVATTIQGKGVFPESHPLWMWPGFGTAAPPFVRRAAADCDATLAIGCRFGEVGTGSYGIEPPAPLIHVDIAPEVFDRNYPAALAVPADAAAFVSDLLEALGTGEASLGTVAADIRQGHEEVRRGWEAEGATDGVRPGVLLPAIQAAFDPDTIYATDSGNGTFIAAEVLRLESPRRFLAPVDYSCMGYSVPAAIGAALGSPTTTVVALVGDGAFLMTGLELLTAASHGVRAAFFVLRDRELAQIAQFQSTAFNRKAASRLPDYDLCAIAGGAGVECLDLDREDQLPAVLESAASILRNGSPVVVGVAIDYSRKTYFTEGVVRTNFGRLPWKDRLRMVARAVGRRITG